MEALLSGGSSPTKRMASLGTRRMNSKVGFDDVTSSNSSVSKQFGFGQKKKKEEENREELSNNAFEYMCYEVTRRVKDNQDIENEQAEALFDQVSPKELTKNPRKMTQTIAQRLKDEAEFGSKPFS